MDWIEVFVLAIVQGISEFLPISSSAHLILVPKLFGFDEQSLAFDIALHVGTLLAILWYFRNDLIPLLKDFFLSIKHQKTIGESKVVWGVLIGTIPVGLAGLIFADMIEKYLRSPLVIAFSTIIFGIFLYISDKKSGKKDILDMSIKLALIIGIAQAIALIPGTSRSGITISMAMFLGFSRVASARISFLLSVPVIILSGGYSGVKIFSQGIHEPLSMLFVAIVLSAISAYFCIKWLIELLQKSTMMPFVIYRLILGAYLFYVFI